MAKRFVDTELWQKQWFQELSTVNKLLVLYIFQNCDSAGVWNTNYRLASFIIGEPVDENDIKYINKQNEMFEKIDDDKIFVLDFIKFQYGTLSENCKPHKPIIEKLKKYGLYERVLKGYSKGIETLEEKEKDKEKEINDPYINPVVNSFKSEYSKLFNCRVFLTSQECNKLCELASDIEGFKETIPIVLEKLKNIDFGFDNFKPTASWLLKDNNYTAVLNGTYDKQESKEDAVFRRLRERSLSG
jgi:hypothetical protein